MLPLNEPLGMFTTTASEAELLRAAQWAVRIECCMQGCAEAAPKRMPTDCPRFSVGAGTALGGPVFCENFHAFDDDGMPAA